MFSLSELEEDNLFQRYKRQTYLVGFPVGSLLILLYITNTVLAGIVSYLAIFMVIEMLLLTALIWQNSYSLNTLELIFYFSICTYFLALIQIAINHLVTVDMLTLSSLAEQLYGLSMWLIVILFGAFFSLKPDQTKLLIVWIVAGMLAMFMDNIWVLSNAGRLTFPFLYQWVNPLSCITLAVLIIRRMGVLQQKHASSDALTGIMNRHALYGILSQEFERARRYKKPFFIVLFDIDLFKGINDTYGHMTGDKVLVEMAKLVGQSIRQTDHLGRWGGEEFLLVLPETEMGAAYTLVERLRQDISKRSFANIDHISVSFGIGVYQSGQTLEDVLHSADNALYKAKHNGRNQVVINYAGK